MRIVGTLYLMFSIVFIPPIIVSIIYHDGELTPFLEALSINFITGFVLWFLFRKRSGNFHGKDGFLIIVLFWVSLGLVSAIPFILILHTSIVDSLFEAISGLTTTGATVLSGLDHMPQSLLFYRQELQWFGGLGLIVLAVAIIPQLGIGGMSIYKAEVPGLMKEEKLTPKLTNTASLLWKIYLGLTIACAIAYWLAGMSVFDAIAHSLTTLSTGGYSTHDESIAYFHSTLIDNIAIFFMLLGGINFGIHYVSFRKHSLLPYWRDSEARLFFIIVIATSLIVGLALLDFNYYQLASDNIENAVFTVVSVITSTGFATTDFSVWPLFLPFFLIVISFIGGCGGSTAGGMKVIRILVLLKLIAREFKQLLHPKGKFLIRLRKGEALPESVLQSVFGFFSLYILSFIFLLVLLVADHIDISTAFSAIATCMNNTGPALGELAQSFSSLDDFGKSISIVSMLLGRLEVVSILVVLNPEYWRI